MTAKAYIAHITLPALLGAQSDELLGVAREPIDGDDEIGFSVDSLSGGAVVVTLLETCDLSMVWDWCSEIADAILDQGDDRINFTRQDGETIGRLAEFRAMRRLLAKSCGFGSGVAA